MPGALVLVAKNSYNYHIEQADKLMNIWLCHFAGSGFAGTESGDNRMSKQRLSYNEAIKSAKLEELYPFHFALLTLKQKTRVVKPFG